eukprot:COSAG05_NODE_910_length_6641_cov_27.153776_4_plen_196_part_00
MPIFGNFQATAPGEVTAANKGDPTRVDTGRIPQPIAKRKKAGIRKMCSFDLPLLTRPCCNKSRVGTGFVYCLSNTVFIFLSWDYAQPPHSIAACSSSNAARSCSSSSCGRSQCSHANNLPIRLSTTRRLRPAGNSNVTTPPVARSAGPSRSRRRLPCAPCLNSMLITQWLHVQSDPAAARMHDFLLCIVLVTCCV